jgi:ADP-ribose pyrophosphatase YjhB (NUDIX family)
LEKQESAQNFVDIIKKCLSWSIFQKRYGKIDDDIYKKFALKMWKNLVSTVWKRMPRRLRLEAIRLTQKKFTVSVVAVVLNEEGKILMLDHFLRPGASWALPGGFIEAGEQPEAAIKREIGEETTLRLENVRLLSVRTINSHVEILFRAEASGKPVPNSAEINAAGWFSLDEMPKETAEIQKQIVRKVLQEK